MPHPSLVAFVDGAEVARLSPKPVLSRAEGPELGARAWLLAVMAVQVTVAEGAVRAILRAHVTGGAAPIVVPLASGSRVDIAIAESAVAPNAVPLTIPRVEPTAAASLTLARDGAVAGTAHLARAALTADPPPRAFAHVYSRWLRGGGHESGYDLTDFLSLPRGTKFERRLQGAVKVPPTFISLVFSAS